MWELMPTRRTDSSWTAVRLSCKLIVSESSKCSYLDVFGLPLVRSSPSCLTKFPSFVLEVEEKTDKWWSNQKVKDADGGFVLRKKRNSLGSRNAAGAYSYFWMSFHAKLAFKHEARRTICLMQRTSSNLQSETRAGNLRYTILLRFIRILLPAHLLYRQ